MNPLLIAALAAGAFALPTDEQVALRQGAWDSSVRAEARGDLRAARVVLARAWAPEVAGYEVTVRLAWLSLRLDDLEAAERLYRRARQLEGAGSEASVGLSSTLTRRGYRQLENGDVNPARASFREALTINQKNEEARRGLDLCHTHPLSFEIWLGGYHVGEPNGATGLLAFTQLRVRPSSWLSLRMAYRFQRFDVERDSGTTRGFMGGRSGTSTTSVNRHELYAGAGAESRWLGAEALGFALLATGERAVGGQAARLRLGRRFGGAMEQALIGFSPGAGWQLVPTLFAWPDRQLGVAAGARLTHDELGSVWAAEAGLSVLVDPLEAYLSGRAGRARWPVSVAIPSVLAVDGDVRFGGALTLMVNLSDTTALGASGELHRLEQDVGDVTYTGVAVGLRLSPPED